MNSIEIFGIRIDDINFKESIEIIEKFLKGNKLRTIYTPNPEIVMKARDNKEVKEIINNGDLVTADGIGIIYASKIKGYPLEERVTGYDMSIEMLKIADREGYRVYLLGGEEGVAKEAGKKVGEKYKNLQVVGTHSGYFNGSHNGHENSEEELKLIEEINNSSPDIIFVGLGFPRQELWIGKNKERIKGKVIIGNGGVIDILAGKAKRAPEIWQKLGLEWLYRLLKNPSRIKRQLVLPKFMLEVMFKRDVIKIKNKEE